MSLAGLQNVYLNLMCGMSVDKGLPPAASV
jgi:hypothetical protein